MRLFKNLKARILKSIITWSEMGKQTAQAKEVYCLLLLQVASTTHLANKYGWMLVLLKMKRVFSRGTVLFFCLWFAMFFFVAQISIFRVTSHVEKTSTLPRLGSRSGGATNDKRTLLEEHVPLNGRCMLKKKN